MITDGRYLLRQHDPQTLWRYDTKWRRRKLFDLGGSTTAIEGDNTILLLHDEGTRLSIRTPADPVSEVASATYKGSGWTFEGPTEAWESVPEYVLVNNQLVRIADDAQSDPLDDVAEPEAIIAVPDSRLIVLAGSGAVTVYDPHARHAGVRLKLSEGTTTAPIMRFRDGDKELWISNGPTLMKLETANWTVLDAAGSPPEEDTPPEITKWNFSNDQSRVFILRNTSDIVMADAKSLALIATFAVNSTPVDVIEIDNDRLMVVDDAGRLPRVRPLPTQ